MGRNKPIFPEYQPFLQKKCPCWESTIFPAATKMQTPALFSSTPSLAPPSNLRSTWPEIPASQHTIQQVGHYPLTIPRKSIVGHPGRSFFHTGRNPAGGGSFEKDIIFQFARMYQKASPRDSILQMPTPIIRLII